MNRAIRRRQKKLLKKNVSGSTDNNANLAEAQNLLQQGIRLHQVNLFDEAIAYYQKSISLQPENVVALSNLGLALQVKGRLDEAIVSFKKAILYKADYAQAHHNLGVTYGQKGEYDLAASCYQKAIDINPAIYESHNNLGITLYNQGKIKESVACYRKLLTIKHDHLEAHYNLGNSLKELGEFASAIAYFKQTLTINPNYAAAYNSIGSIQQITGELEEAVASYKKALVIDDNYALAHYNLGNALKEQKQFAGAIASYQRSITIDPNYVDAHNNLGNIYKETGRYKEASSCYNRAISIKPDYAESYSNLGANFLEQCKLDEAIIKYKKAITIQPDNAKTHYNLSLAQLLTGNFKEGLQNFKWRWQTDQFEAKRYLQQKTALWQGEPLSGKNMLVWSEQGIGENIIFSSMLPELINKGANIVVECDNRLAPIFLRSFPSIRCTPRGDPAIYHSQLSQYDYIIPFGDLCSQLRKDIGSFPAQPFHLVADQEKTEKLRNRYKQNRDVKLIGLAWYSKNPSCSQKKSIKLMQLQSLFKIPNTIFVDLQYGDTSDERSEFSKQTGLNIIHDDTIDQMQDLDSFAAQTAAMDLVITISNSTSHMAGGLGVPSLLMLGPPPIWYWMMEGDRSLWYQTTRIFRQKPDEGWDRVIKDVTTAAIGFLEQDL
ncbi:MAG: tetratricopeptide repeat protein [Magnetococcales bacterium]|nr:tetratricopeptide repeat protein [Magnetococcales bacterium]